MSQRPLPRLVLFPGLGIDARIFLPQRPIRARIEVPPWIRPTPGESFESYAQRLAATVDPTPPLFLGGMSFGGSIAIEAARWLKPRGVFVIASCFSHRAYAPYVKFVARSAGKMADPVMRTFLASAPLVIRWVGRPNREQRRLLLTLVDDADTDLTRWGGPAMMDWEFRGPLSAPTWQVHGKIDRLIPHENVRADLLIPEAGHVVNVTHAPIVNEFIEEKMGV